MQRNFQGYSTNKECDLFSFGVSAISSICSSILQNHKDIKNYARSLDQSKLAICRGVILNNDDSIRKAVINQLKCNFELPFEAIENQFNIKFKQYFEDELEALAQLEKDGLLSITPTKITVKDAGRLLIRSICMTFDAYLDKQVSANQNRYSRII
ncbi:MAG: oxygen-independent coproporphyrinogen-3 oxidase [Lentisphaeria bacterium]